MKKQQFNDTLRTCICRLNVRLCNYSKVKLSEVYNIYSLSKQLLSVDIYSFNINPDCILIKTQSLLFKNLF